MEANKETILSLSHKFDILRKDSPSYFLFFFFFFQTILIYSINFSKKKKSYSEIDQQPKAAFFN